jgi:hypothetical protein
MTETPDRGQLSETSRLDEKDADTPISDGDAVAGYPTSESGDAQEGDETGPNAHTGSEHDEPVEE